MKHNKIKELIQKSLDHELNAHEQKLLKEHLSQCPSCYEAFKALSHTDAALRHLPEFYPGAGFNERVMKALGLRKVFVPKAVAAFAGAWLISIILLAFSPLPGYLLNQVLTSAPALARIINKSNVIISSLNHIIMPFVKNSFDITWPIIGLVGSILITYLFSKTIAQHRGLKTNIASSFRDENLIS
jgi:hypothetical protein